MNKKARKLAIKYDTLAKQMTKDFPWEGDKPVPLRAHMFEVEEVLV